jgi:hypothetical protein
MLAITMPKHLSRAAAFSGGYNPRDELRRSEQDDPERH